MTDSKAKCPVDHSQFASEFNPFRPDFIANPYSSFAQARAEEPIFYSPQMDMWIATKHDDLKDIMKDTEAFSSAGGFTAAAQASPVAFEVMGGLDHPLIKYSVINVDAPLHTRLRGALQKAFTPRQTSQLEPQIRELTSDLLDVFPEGGPAEFVAGFCNPLPLFIICRLLGVPDDDAQQIKTWSESFVALQIPGQPEDVQRMHGKNVVAYFERMIALVKHYRQNPAKNLTSEMVHAENPLTDEEIAGHLCNVVLAGHETTAKLMGNMLHNILTQRELWDTLIAHPGYIPGAVNEFIRYDTSLMGLYRVTTHDVAIGDVTVPAHSRVWVAYAAGNHDPAVFPEPNTIDIHRDNATENLTFGYGIHYCLGAPLAKLELQIVLEELTRRMPSLRFIPDQQLVFNPNFILRSYQQLMLEWDA